MKPFGYKYKTKCNKRIKCFTFNRSLLLIGNNILHEFTLA